MASDPMESATQKTPHEAAALIQARVRGHQQRSKQSRAITAITKLQARQRGRYTRREYQKLLEFYNEQESFLAESKRRQLRLWHREQELYFLQHTTTDELDRIRQFQYEKSARRIQREWKRLHPKPLEDVDVSGLGKPFDPFGLLSEPRSPSAIIKTTDRGLIKKELFGDLPRKAPASQDTEKLARRRAEIQDKLQRRRKDQDKENKEKSQGQKSRRELFNTLVGIRQDTARRLQETSEKYRKSRVQRDLEAAQLSASCRNRLAFLQDETRIHTLLDTSRKAALQEQIHRERRRFEEDTATWRDDRRCEAWENHSRILQSVLGKTKWYETVIAGERQDIRRVYAESPWENERQVWQWPPHGKATDSQVDKSAGKSTGVTAMDRFMFGLTEDGDENSPDNQGTGESRPVPMEDELASSWWRAHATQSHFSYSRLQQKQQQRERRRLTGNNYGTGDAQVTPEMLANPRFYELYKQSIATNRQTELVQSVDSQIARLQRQIQQKVVEMETQIDVNTRVILEKASLVQQQRARKTKEESATIQIQRTVRGKLGRKRAQEHLAEFFVMVRGRAIRKGKCEECGEAQAVLECKQCEESLHFCPVCWVQVHSTRRRKTHVAIPMAVDVSNQGIKPSKEKEKDSLRIDTRPVGASALSPYVVCGSSAGLPDNAARGTRVHNASSTTQEANSPLKQAAAPVDAALDAAVKTTGSHKTTRSTKPATARGVKPQGRLSPDDTTPLVTGDDLPASHLSATSTEEGKSRAVALSTTATSEEAIVESKRQGEVKTPSSESAAPPTQELQGEILATEVAKQKTGGVVAEHNSSKARASEASVTDDAAIQQPLNDPNDEMKAAVPVSASTAETTSPLSRQEPAANVSDTVVDTETPAPNAKNQLHSHEAAL